MRFPDPYSDRDDGHVPRQPEDTDACFHCGQTRSKAASFVPRGSQRERSIAALVDASPRDSKPGTLHLCIRCVKFLAQCAGLVGATKHHELVITCATDRGCPWGAGLSLSPRPLSLAALTQALKALGWVSGPTGKAFLCPRCVEAL